MSLLVKVPGLREGILAPGSLNHFRNPMACDVQRREPFDADDARAVRDGSRADGADSIEPIV